MAAHTRLSSAGEDQQKRKKGRKGGRKGERKEGETERKIWLGVVREEGKVGNKKPDKKGIKHQTHTQFSDEEV